MIKTTYLFGAGASCQVLPLTVGIPARLDRMAEILEHKDFTLQDGEKYTHSNIEKGKRDTQIQFIEDLRSLAKEAKQHASIDTLAKKLFIRDNNEKLIKLKTILSVFLVLEQAGRLDTRYDSFFASIIGNRSSSLPPNLKIITWNYDYQLEKAYTNFSGDERLSAAQSMLNCYYKNIRCSKSNDKFSAYNLNGSAGFYFDSLQSREYQFLDKFDMKFSIELIDEILKVYFIIHHVPPMQKRLLSSISFAWEDDYSNNNIIANTIEGTMDTTILVVIGYSFPFFNREVDRKIIRGMSKLEKVYFQAPDAEDIKERFLAIRDNIPDRHLLIRKDIEQFVFPNEF